MKSWALWNTNLSIYRTVYLTLKCSYLVISAQFFILRVIGSAIYHLTYFFISAQRSVSLLMIRELGIFALSIISRNLSGEL